MSKNELEQRIDELRMVAYTYEDLEHATEEEAKEEVLLDEVVTALDKLRYFYEKQRDRDSIQNVKLVDQGLEYALGIRDNVAHVM